MTRPDHPTDRDGLPRPDRGHPDEPVREPVTAPFDLDADEEATVDLDEDVDPRDYQEWGPEDVVARVAARYACEVDGVAQVPALPSTRYWGWPHEIAAFAWLDVPNCWCLVDLEVDVRPGFDPDVVAIAARDHVAKRLRYDLQFPADVLVLPGKVVDEAPDDHE